MRSKGLIGLLAVFALGSALAITGDEVMKKVEAHPTPKTMHGVMEMHLINKSGKKLTRKLELWQKKEGEVEKMLIKFLAPADVKGTAFLVIRKGDKEEMKLYLPALKRVRRISASQKKGSFMGSDFTYEDISKLGALKTEDYKNKLLREDTLDGKKVYVVEAVPKPGVDTIYDKMVIWVWAEKFHPLKIEFFQKGKKVKVMTLSAFKTFAGGKYELPTRLLMENLKTHHKTELLQENLELDIAIPDSVFTERFMKR